MAGKAAVRLGNGMLIDTDHFNFHDEGRRITTRDKYAMVYAWKALDKEAPYAMAIAMPHRLIGAASGSSAKDVVRLISNIVIAEYGAGTYRPKKIALVANFYPDVDLSVLVGTGAETYLATVEYVAQTAMQETQCIDAWTERNIIEEDKDDRKLLKYRANKRALLHPRFWLIG